MIENIKVESCWYKGPDCMVEQPEGYHGFIYCIVDDNYKIYIGKKAFVHKTKKILSKKARLAAGGRKRIERGTKDSNWMSYWGSSKELLKYIEDRGGTHGFQRIILKLCKDAASLSFWEVYWMIKYEVLFRDDCYNGNISGRFFKGKIHE